MKIFVAAFCSLFFCLSSFAFLNIESLRQSKVSDGISGSSRFSLSQTKGNVDKVLIRGTTLNQYKNNGHSFLLMAAYQYGESFSELDNRNGHLHFRYNYTLRKLTSFEFYQQSEFNKFQNLESRYLIGGGLRQGLLNSKLISLYSGLGSFYEEEKLANQVDQRNPRANFYLSLLMEKKKDYSISSTLYYQPNLEDFADARFRFNIGLETFFGSSFSQSFEFSLNRDSRPPPGVQKTDSSIVAGIGLRY